MGEPMPRTDSTQAMQSIFSAYGEDEAADDVAEDDDEAMPEAVEEEEKEPEKSVDEVKEVIENPVENVDNISDEEDLPHSSQAHSPADMDKSPPAKRMPFVDIEDNSHSDMDEAKRPKLLRRTTAKLVSYVGDEADDADEDDDDLDSSGELDPQSLVNYDLSMDTSLINSTMSQESHVELPGDDVRLPAEPTRKCSKDLQQKILDLYNKKKRGLNLNSSIQCRKDFTNPSIYEKLIDMLGIDEKGTNYPPELYTNAIWGPESYYDELAKSQKTEMDKREKEKKDRTKVEFVTVVTKKPSAAESSASEQKRKSKWDNQPPSQAVAKPTLVTTASINPPVISLSTSSSGSKTTVISAVGAIKKPK